MGFDLSAWFDPQRREQMLRNPRTQSGGPVPDFMLNSQPQRGGFANAFANFGGSKQYAGMGTSGAGGGTPGIYVGGQFMPGWTTAGKEKERAADYMNVMSQWKQGANMGQASYLDWVKSEQLRNEARTPGMFWNPDTPVAPWAQHDYNGPPSNLARDFGLNDQANAIRGQAAAADASVTGTPEWKPGLTGALLGKPLFHEYNNGVDMGRQNQAPYAGMSDAGRRRAQALEPYAGLGVPSQDEINDARLMHRQPDGSYSHTPPPAQAPKQTNGGFLPLFPEEPYYDTPDGFKSSEEDAQEAGALTPFTNDWAHSKPPAPLLGNPGYNPTKQKGGQFASGEMDAGGVGGGAEATPKLNAFMKGKGLLEAFRQLDMLDQATSGISSGFRSYSGQSETPRRDVFGSEDRTAPNYARKLDALDMFRALADTDIGKDVIKSESELDKMYAIMRKAKRGVR